MKTKWLFSHSFRLIGWVIFIPATILGLAALYADFKVDCPLAERVGNDNVR